MGGEWLPPEMEERTHRVRGQRYVRRRKETCRQDRKATYEPAAGTEWVVVSHDAASIPDRGHWEVPRPTRAAALHQRSGLWHSLEIREDAVAPGKRKMQARRRVQLRESGATVGWDEFHLALEAGTVVRGAARKEAWKVLRVG